MNDEEIEKLMGRSLTPEECDVIRRTLANHDPTLEPYASMSIDEIRALMNGAASIEEHEMLYQYFLDKLPPEQLTTINHANAISAFLIKEYEARGFHQNHYLCKLAGELAARIAKDMGPECN